MEKHLTSYLFGEYARIAHVMDMRAQQEEVVSEIVIALWHVSSDATKLRWRAVARNLRIKDVEAIWATTSMSIAERTKWDAEAIAAWRDQVIEDVAKRPTYLAELRLGLIQMLSQGLQAEIQPGSGGRQLLMRVPGYEGLHLNVSSHDSARSLSVAATEPLLAYDHTAYEESCQSLAIILRSFGNMGGVHHLDLALNFTSHPDSDVRQSAITSLRNIAGDHPLPVDTAYKAGRRLIVRRDPHGRRLSSEALPPRAALAPLAAYVHPSVSAFLDAAIEQTADEHARHGVTALFGHVRGLTPRGRSLVAQRYGVEEGFDDVEAHTLQIALGDYPRTTRLTSLKVLSALRPLRLSTMDALLAYYEHDLKHINALYSKELCASNCLTSRGECAILSIPICVSNCELDCEWDQKMAVNIAAILHDRVKAEIVSQRRLASLDETGLADREENDMLVSRRLEEAHARLTASHKAYGAARDTTVHPHAFKPRVLSEATLLNRQPLSVARRRVLLSLDNENGRTPAHVMYRARKLGVLTLLGEFSTALSCLHAVSLKEHHTSHFR